MPCPADSDVAAASSNPHPRPSDHFDWTFARNRAAGESVSLNDGRIEGIVESVSNEEVVVNITEAKPSGSPLRSNKGINFPDTDFDLQGLTVKDREDLPFIVEYAEEAIRRVDLEPFSEPVRGGTDGSRLTAMGLPTPNLFTGAQNIHSRREWADVDDMVKAVQMIVELTKVWAERGEG